jgi:hypothetical protein
MRTKAETKIYHAERFKLRSIINAHLKLHGWRATEIAAYFKAQETHGILRQGLKIWEIRSSIITWHIRAPIGKPSVEVD